MKAYRSRNVFRDLGFAAAEAKNLERRAAFMTKISEYIRRNGLTMEKAAETFGVNTMRIRDLMRGRIEAFSIEALTAMYACMKRKASMQVDRDNRSDL